MTTTNSVTHMAGVSVTHAGRVRQRCAWCGTLIVDKEQGSPTWPVPMWVQLIGADEIGRGGQWTAYPISLDHTEGELSIPPNACVHLPLESTS